MLTTTTMAEKNYIPIDLTDLIPHFPWARMFDELGYHMPYPEVLMTSDRAYALSTQVNGLLMMQAWEVDNKASYHLETIEQVSHQAYRLCTQIEMGALDEAWAVVGITAEALLSYLDEALVGYVMKTSLSDKSLRPIRLAQGSWMLVTATE